MAVVPSLTVFIVSHRAAHAGLVVGAFSVLYFWLFSRGVREGGYFAESDLYEYHLPVFRSPLTIWSDYEFAGFPAFADPQNATWYPLHALFALLIPSWTAFIVSAYVLGACFTYAYVYSYTRSAVAAVVSALGFGLGEALMLKTAHATILHAIVWLPLMLLAIDKLQHAERGRWVAIGAVAVACCVLAGHPQAAVYSVYCAVAYAAVGGLANRAGRAYYGAVVALFSIGALLAAVQIVPLVEASELIARKTVNFGHFVSAAKSPAELMRVAVMPAVPHEGRDAPVYVGLGVLVLALVGATQVRRNWRWGFWLAITVVAVLLGLGTATPLTTLAYEIPLYDKFRLVARHLYLASFGLSVLAAGGLCALRTGLVRTRAVIGALLAVCALMVTVVYESRHDFATLDITTARLTALNEWPIFGGAVWLQLGIMALTGAAILASRISWLATVWPVAFIVVLGGDLLNSQPEALGSSGLDRPLIRPEDLAPSVHVRHLVASAGHQRLLAFSGSATDALIPGSMPRLWKVASAGGYSSMLLERHRELGSMGTDGSIHPYVLRDVDVALDLLAVRYIIVRAAALMPGSWFEREGLLWEEASFELPVGRDDCGFAHRASASLWLAVKTAVKGVAIVGRLRCAEDLKQADVFGQLTIHSASGEQVIRHLRAGVELAESALGEAEVLERAGHRRAHVFERSDDRLSYVLDVRFKQPFTPERITFDWSGKPGWLVIDRITLLDTADISLPQALVPMLFADRTRWRMHGSIRTSRTTDRRADTDEPNEEEFVIYENLRAMPRAWIVPEIVAVTPHDGLQAIRTSMLPDGRPFDPHRTALVEVGSAPPVTSVQPGQAEVEVRRIEDGRVTLSVDTERGGYLVLSDTYYPGWRAYVDGGEMPVYRTNLSLRGAAVPPGRHQVVFRFVPRSLHLGAGLSVLGGILIGVTSMRAWRRSQNVAQRATGAESHAIG